ncbi:unnamed protein product [Allacma fusca]|uniref:Glycoside hydrolase family 20 catalytic domain-containing protein n=1 Tax=Allacma fusca TaxID=39272 RepID=A0A8J2NJI8_9HEXA|nr:unnamed protein product [Allacma fusca]
MSSLFLYYPDGVSVPVFASEHGLGLQDSKGHYGDRVEYLAGDQSKKTRHHLFLDMNEEEYEASVLGSSSGKIRHQAHHGRLEDGEGSSRGSLVQMGMEDLEEKSVFSNVVESRLIHLDLKGAPPRISYIKEVLRLGKASGINGVLIEWEDTFPWKDNLENLTLTRGGYNLSEVEEIISFAEVAMNMEVIPLVQTFGHVEFILKSEQLRHLREVDGDPQSYCPSKMGTMDIITDMIDQVLEVHKNARYIHIGCDEVVNLHMCSLCQSAFESRDEVFLHHVTRVASIVRKKDKIPIIWDDMLRSVPAKRLVDSGIGSLVEPMVWVYAEDIDRFVGWESWEKYSKIFPTIWAAAAFKGAFGETLTIPPLSRHAENSQRWVDVLTRESVRWQKGVGGLVLTGWQRYDHFAVLCELLPAAIPSLVYTSLIISTPSGGAAIRNRMFVAKNQSILPTSEPEKMETSTVTLTSSLASKGVLEVTPESSSDSSAPTPMDTSPPIDLSLSRSERSTRRRIPHPRSLMQKEAGMSRFGMSSDVRPLHARERMSEAADKNQLISRQFHRILHCSNHPESIAGMIKEAGDAELAFASRCNFPGVAFFRTLFRLRSLLKEIWELEEKVLRGRAWATAYNVRHNYSLPSRIDEVIFNQVPRFRRQLSMTAKSVAISLKSIFKGEVVLEWLEQNVWEAWQTLDSFEKVGDRLKRIAVWPRRPLKSPPEMIDGLGLQAVDLGDHEEL